MNEIQDIYESMRERYLDQRDRLDALRVQVSTTTPSPSRPASAQPSFRPTTATRFSDTRPGARSPVAQCRSPMGPRFQVSTKPNESIRMAQGRFFEEPLSPSPQQPTVREQHLEQPPTVRERQLEAEVQRLRAAAATGAGQSASSALSPSRPPSFRPTTATRFSDTLPGARSPVVQNCRSPMGPRFQVSTKPNDPITAKGRLFEELLSPSMPGFTGSTIYIPTQQPPTVREQQLEAEVRRLRGQLDAAAAKDAGQSASSPLSICQRYKCGNGAPPGSSWAGTRKQQLKIGNRVAHTGCAEHIAHLQGTRVHNEDHFSRDGSPDWTQDEDYNEGLGEMLAEMEFESKRWKAMSPDRLSNASTQRRSSNEFDTTYFTGSSERLLSGTNRSESERPLSGTNRTETASSHAQCNAKSSFSRGQRGQSVMIDETGGECESPLESPFSRAKRAAMKNISPNQSTSPLRSPINGRPISASSSRPVSAQSQSRSTLRSPINGRPVSASSSRAVPISSRNYDYSGIVPRSPNGRPASASFIHSERMMNLNRSWGAGYTGHVPHMRGAYGVLKSKALDEVSNTVPPLSPMVHLTWVNGGRREVLVPEGLALPGTTLTGSLKPTYVDTSDDAGTYEQGSKVDVQGYYDAVEATLPIKCASPDVQAKAALKYRSHIINGDKFYFAGSHNYVTSNQEVYSPENALNREVPEESFMSVEGRSHWRERDLKVAHGDGSLFSPLLSSDSPMARPRSEMSVKSSPGEAHSLVHDYRATMAVVGKKKIGQLETLIMDKIYARVSRQTPNAYQKIWRFFDRQSNGKLTQQEFFDACWQLGVRLTKTETMALYGGYDIDRDGVLNYYEFLHNVLQEKEIDQDNNAQRRVQAR